MGAIRRVQNGAWEKNRRERLNMVFNELNQLLPDYDPTLSRSKVDILTKSINYIKELQNKHSNMLESNCSQTLKDEMSTLKKRLVDLKQRNRQLADLLRQADISIPEPPPPLPFKPFAPPRKWKGRRFAKSCNSDSLNPVPTDTKKKNENLKMKPTKTKSLKQKSPKPNKNLKSFSSSPIKNSSQPSTLTLSATNLDTNPLIKTTTPLREINSDSSNIRTVTVPCTTVSLVLSNSKTNIVTVAKSNLLAAPIMATGIQPVLDRNPTLSSLGPGTLILPDGRIVSVPPILAPATQIIVNRPPPQPAVFLMQNVPSVKPPKTTSHLRTIVPKTKKDSTKTTYVNKVPIPTIRASQIVSSKIAKKKRTDNTQTVVKVVENKIELAKETQQTKLIHDETYKKPLDDVKKLKSQNNILKEKGDSDKIRISKENTLNCTVASTRTQPAGQKVSSSKRKVCDINKTVEACSKKNKTTESSEEIQNSQANSTVLSKITDNSEKRNLTILSTREQSQQTTNSSFSTLNKDKNIVNTEGIVRHAELNIKVNSALKDIPKCLVSTQQSYQSPKGSCQKESNICESSLEEISKSKNENQGTKNVSNNGATSNVTKFLPNNINFLEGKSILHENKTNEMSINFNICDSSIKLNGVSHYKNTTSTINQNIATATNTDSTDISFYVKSQNVCCMKQQDNREQNNSGNLVGSTNMSTENIVQNSSNNYQTENIPVVIKTCVASALSKFSTSIETGGARGGLQNDKSCQMRSSAVTSPENLPNLMPGICMISQNTSSVTNVQKAMATSVIENFSPFQNSNTQNDSPNAKGQLENKIVNINAVSQEESFRNPSLIAFGPSKCTVSKNNLKNLMTVSHGGNVDVNSENNHINPSLRNIDVTEINRRNLEPSSDFSNSSIETRGDLQSNVPKQTDIKSNNMHNATPQKVCTSNNHLGIENNHQALSSKITVPTENVENVMTDSQTANDSSRKRNPVSNTLSDETRSDENNVTPKTNMDTTKNLFEGQKNQFQTSLPEITTPTENGVRNKSTTETVSKKSTENTFGSLETINKAIPTSCSKSTQVTTVQFSLPENSESSAENKSVQTAPIQQSTVDRKKVESGAKKNSSENKSLIHDVGQDLTNLFPYDPKLQVCPDNIFQNDFRDRNLFLPISHSYMDEVRVSFPHSDFSNDLFSSLQVPTGGQHPESISPTAAFLLAFPLVSTSKTSEMLAENDTGESQHATPTTILQIGNIDQPNNELFHQTSLMIDNNVTDFQDALKINKPTENSKNTKQMKEMDHFNKFQQLEMNDLMRNDNFSRNNCKEKKNFLGVQDENNYLPCNKKKLNERACEFPIANEVINHYNDKSFEFSSNATKQNVQHQQINHTTNTRHTTNTNNQKKTQFLPENVVDHQNSFNSSQSYSFNSYPPGNDFSFPNSNYFHGNQTSKASQPITGFNTGNSWSSSTATSTTSCVDYTAPYCSYPQKPNTNSSLNKQLPKNMTQTSYEDQRLKQKPNSSNSSLPKFSSNFQFNSNSRQNSDANIYHNTSQIDNATYKLEPKTKKQKIIPQRPPVNWMTTPDIRPVIPDQNIPPVFPDVIFPTQKDLDFNATGNNSMINTSSNITPFSISSTVSNNPQTFYPSSHFSGIDFQLDFAPFPEISSSKPSKNAIVTSSSQNFSWSPSKSSIPLLPHIDTHMIPSTLPTLVGDLALGTTTPSGPMDTFRNLSMPTTPFSSEAPSKKCETKLDSQKPFNKSPEKDCFSNSERRNSNRNISEFCQKTHSHQSTNTTSSFLSVSQLVDPAKSEQTLTRKHGKPNHSKNNTNVLKKNVSHNSDKTNHSKTANNINNSNNNLNSYQPTLANTNLSNQRKTDTTASNYRSDQVNLAYPNVFSNNTNQHAWQNNNSKPNRTTHLKNNYSAASLIGERPTTQNHLAELPPFSMANQYNNAQKPFSATPIVSSAYSNSEFPNQSLQPLEFHSSHHPNQNCFNFPSHNSHFSEDYNIGLDSLYSLNPPPQKSALAENRAMHKRNPLKRRDEFPQMGSNQQMQYFPRDTSSLRGPKCPPASSPSHHGTTSLTNFNLSTIFPEINDKRAVQEANPFLTTGSKMSENSTGRSGSGCTDYSRNDFNPPPQMQQVGIPPPPTSFANIGQPPTNFRPQ